MVGTSDTSQGIFDIRLRRRSSDAGRLLSKVAFGNTPHFILQVLYDQRLSVASQLRSSGWATSGRSHVVVHCDCAADQEKHYNSLCYTEILTTLTHIYITPEVQIVTREIFVTQMHY
jgi:hypothetical protein